MTHGLKRAARVAGFCYIVVITLGVSQAVLVSSHLPSLEDPGSVVAVLRDESLRFRIGVLGDALLYALVLVLAVALYLLVRRVNGPLALGGLVLRSAEAVVGLSATVVGAAVPQLLASKVAGGDPSPIIALLTVRDSALDVVLMLVGFGGATFCYLFFSSRLVPAALAGWGVLTYASMSVLGAAGILLPNVAESLESALFAQGALFELLFGLWLLLSADNVARRAAAT